KTIACGPRIHAIVDRGKASSRAFLQVLVDLPANEFFVVGHEPTNKFCSYKAFEIVQEITLCRPWRRVVPQTSVDGVDLRFAEALKAIQQPAILTTFKSRIGMNGNGNVLVGFDPRHHARKVVWENESFVRLTNKIQLNDAQSVRIDDARHATGNDHAVKFVVVLMKKFFGLRVARWISHPISRFKAMQLSATI